MMLQNLKKTEELMFWVLSAYTLNKLLDTLIRPVSSQMQVTWLINYDAGFTKRGLLGTVIKHLFESDSIILINEIAIKLIIIAVIFSYFLIIYRYRTNIHITLLLTMSPALIMFPLNDRYVPGRIEHFGIIITIINCLLIKLYLTNQNKINKLKSKLIRYMLTFVVGILPVLLLSILLFSHEVTLLLILPINFLVTFIFIFNIGEKNNEFKSLFCSIVFYLPAVLSFLYILTNKNDSLTHANELCDKIKDIVPHIIRDNCTDPYFILEAHVRPFQAVMKNTLPFISDHFMVYCVFLLLGTYLSICTISTIISVFKVEKTQELSEIDGAFKEVNHLVAPGSDSLTTYNNSNLTAIMIYFFILPFICTLPLYPLTRDWGRWIAITNLQFVLVSLIFLKPTVFLFINIPFINKIPSFFRNHTQTDNMYNLKTLVVFIIICFLFRLPHWANHPKWFLSENIFDSIRRFL